MLPLDGGCACTKLGERIVRLVEGMGDKLRDSLFRLI